MIIYETEYESYFETNVISVGKGETPWTWVWDNGKAVFEDSYKGQGTWQPGFASGCQTCTVSKNDDASLTIISNWKSSGRWFWVIPVEEPEGKLVDQSVIQLVPVIPPVTLP